MTLAPGYVIQGLSGRYTLLSKVKEGGMATIYHGKSESGEDVVIKAPKITMDGNDHIRLQKLRVEASILKGLQFPNIVRYLDEQDKGDAFFLVLEKINGSTLREKYSGVRMDEATAGKYAVRLLQTLNHLHHKNIIHRDVNPRNVMEEALREIILIDFGAAKMNYVQMTAQGTVMFTPGWEAPEQRLGAASPASDIYSVGAILFFLLTGKEPRLFMQGDGTLTKLPNELEPTVSREISKIVKKAMQVDPRLRYESAQDMVEEIATGRNAPVGVPHIVFMGVKYPIRDSAIIGREHAACDAKCKGFSVRPDIAVADTQNYLSRHHVRIATDRKGRFTVEDLGSVNKSAVSKDGGLTYRILGPNAREELRNGDVVAVAYNSDRGAYTSFTFWSI
jgi:serine/threonine protein kinase